MAAHLMITLALALLAPTSVDAQQLRVVVQPIPDGVWSRMQGRSWRPNLRCPQRHELALLSIPFWDFAGNQQWGALVVASSEAGGVARAFQEIFDGRAFRIAKMRLVDDYDGNDDASMEDNNTSGFNCRAVVGTQRLSKHARGMAIDINPIQNPYLDGRETAPKAGRVHDEPHERKAGIVGLIRKGDVVTKAFARIGWSWGGDFRHAKDYQHFAR